MRILVTGANGYLGQGVVRALLNQGHEVIATDLAIENIDKRANCIVANLFEVENPYSYYQKPDVLLHMAWRDGFVHNSENHLGDLNKHYLFLKKMICAGIKRVAVMGTMHEVGFHEGSIDENTPCHPQSLYGVAKNALRDAVEILTKQNKVCFQWLRAYYIVGNAKFGNSIFSKITTAEENGQETFPFTTGQNQYDFIDYEEFTNQVVLAISQCEVDGVINICSGQPERLATRIERFISENNFKIKLAYGTYPDRAYDSKAVWGNNSKINKIIANSLKKQV